MERPKGYGSDLDSAGNYELLDCNGTTTGTYVLGSCVEFV